MQIAECKMKDAEYRMKKGGDKEKQEEKEQAKVKKCGTLKAIRSWLLAIRKDSKQGR